MHRILFICSCLERGKDGVGDYIRILSHSLSERGYVCSIISVNDKYITECLLEAELSVNIIRIPSKFTTSKKTYLTRNFIIDFSPDLISFQIVPYGFNKRGIMFNETNYFRKIAHGYDVHMMFHELWLGEFKSRPLKEKIIGKIQKTCILSIIKSLNPIFIHTNTQIFQYYLSQNKIKSFLLPVFSNIRVLNNSNITIAEITSNINSNTIILTFFGGIEETKYLWFFFEKINAQAAQLNRKIMVISIGIIRSGSPVWLALENKYGKSINFVQLGALTEEEICFVFSKTTIGLSTYPLLFVEKSGSIAAMVEYGLQVIILGDREDLNGFNFQKTKLHENIILEENFNYENLLPKKILAPNLLINTAETFIKDLNI